MENGIWNVFRNNRIEDEEQHRKGINLKKEEMTNMDFLLEAVGIVAAMIYLGLQIYYGIVYALCQRCLKQQIILCTDGVGNTSCVLQ